MLLWYGLSMVGLEVYFCGVLMILVLLHETCCEGLLL